MHYLGEVTGQNAAVAQILERRQLPRKECIIVSGPGGCGTSWTLTQAGIEWEHKGGIALRATGAAVTPPRPLLPWLTMASPARSTLARWDVLKESAAEASKAIPVVGEAASYLVGEVLNYRRKNLARQTQVLGEREQDLLYVIETAAQGKRLLLLVDQMANWDDESWSLLEIIISPILHDLYSSLKDVVIVIGASAEFLPRCRALVERLPLAEYHLRRLQRVNISVALNEFSFPTLGEQEFDLLYEATGGRLDLLHDFGALGQDFGVAGLAGTNALYGQMIERRLRALKGNVASLDQLLTAASFLGNSFSPEEARCLTGYSAEDLQRTLRLAEEEHLLALAGGYVSFPSVAMQQYFRSSRVSDPGTYHSKFAQCLRRLRPGDYEARSQHHLLAGEVNEAMVCHSLACLDAHRRRSPVPESGLFDSLGEWSEYSSYLEAMMTAYAAHDADAINEGLSVLESIEAILPDVLIAERDYLKARICLKSPRTASFEQAVITLRRWLSLQDGESEIWSRVVQTLIIALVETNRHEEARQMEEALTKYFGGRRAIDPWALYGLNCLRRSSECLYQLVPARTRLQSALAYFGPTSPGALPRHPLQYYYALTNLVSNLIAGGCFAEAVASGSSLAALVQGHVSFPWPSLEIASNNLILAGYLAGALPLVEAIDKMREIDQNRDGIGDQILVHNNLAVLLIHQGDLNQAQQILDEIQRQLGGSGESDAYHRYFVANNLAGLAALGGSPDRALQLLEQVGQDLDRFYPAIRETLRQRHALMPEALRAAPRLGAMNFDAFLKDHHVPQVGPQWAFYGRGFLLSDIQFWASD